MIENIIIDGIEYKLTPKRVLTDEEFIKYVLEKNKIDFNVGDIVWYNGVIFVKGITIDVVELKKALLESSIQEEQATEYQKTKIPLLQARECVVDTIFEKYINKIIKR